MKQETKRKIEISNLHEFADSLILIDNRIDRCKKHQASTIVLIAISAVICGADTWNSIEDFGKSKESFFAAKLSNFTPKGVSLAGVGITPDVVVPVDEETADAIYYDQLEPEDDPQIQAALELLEKK